MPWSRPAGPAPTSARACEVGVNDGAGPGRRWRGQPRPGEPRGERPAGAPGPGDAAAADPPRPGAPRPGAPRPGAPRPGAAAPRPGDGPPRQTGAAPRSGAGFDPGSPLRRGGAPGAVDPVATAAEEQRLRVTFLRLCAAVDALGAATHAAR